MDWSFEQAELKQLANVNTSITGTIATTLVSLISCRPRPPSRGPSITHVPPAAALHRDATTSISPQKDAYRCDGRCTAHFTFSSLHLTSTNIQPPEPSVREPRSRTSVRETRTGSVFRTNCPIYPDAVGVRQMCCSSGIRNKKSCSDRFYPQTGMGRSARRSG